MRNLRAMIDFSFDSNAESIIDRSSLETWLKSLSVSGREFEKISQTIAWRCAARVLPIYWEWALTSKSARNADISPQPFLRGLLVAALSADETGAEIRNAAKHARNHVIGVSKQLAAPAEAAHAARSVRSAVANAEAATAARTANAANSACQAMGNPGRLWAEVRSDVYQILDNRSFSSLPLWRDENPLHLKWTSLAYLLEGENGADLTASLETGDWEFWLDWYGSLLSGQAFMRKPRGVFVEVALLPDKFWASPKAFNERVQKIESRQEKTATAVSGGTVERTQVINAMSRSRRSLPQTFEAITSLLVFEIERLQIRNFSTDREQKEAQRQIGVYLSLFDAVEGLQANLPKDGPVSEVQAEESIKLLKLYRDKLSELPKEKVDEVTEGVWDFGKGALQFGLIGAASTLAISYGMPQLGAVSVAAMCIAPKRAGDVIKVARESWIKASG